MPDSDPTFADGYARLAETYGRLEDGSNALGAHVRAADLMPDALDIQLSAGRYLLTSGRFDDALSRADAVIARDPGSVSAHVLRGNALSGLNDLDASLLQIAQAVAKARPDTPEIVDTLGWTYHKKNLPEHALPLLRHARRRGVAVERAV